MVGQLACVRLVSHYGSAVSLRLDPTLSIRIDPSLTNTRNASAEFDRCHLPGAGRDGRHPFGCLFCTAEIERNPIFPSLRFMKGLSLDPAVESAYVKLTDNDIMIIERNLNWMKNFKQSLNVITLDASGTKRYFIRIFHIERFASWWKELNAMLEKLELENGAAHPLIKELKEFMDDPTTTQTANLAMTISKTHEKLKGLLNELQPMVQQGNRQDGENSEKMRKLLIEARTSLKDLHPIHALVDGTPAELKRILKLNKFAVINKLVSGELSWATQPIK